MVSKSVLKLTPAARDDLYDIWRYGVTRWGEAKADQYFHQLFDAMDQLARQPQQGRSRPDIAPGYLSFVCASHTIYYQMNHESLIVIGILHQSMDVFRHLPHSP